jgi:phosphatidylglycerophosphate synthase
VKSRIPPIPELRTIVYKSEEKYGRIPDISKAIIHPYVSIYFTRLFLCLGMSGNQVTLLMTGCALASAAFYFVGGTWGYAAAGGLMLLAWVLDHSDGEVLRYRKQSSALGIYLDRFTHRISYPLMHIGTGFSLWQSTGVPAYQLFGSLVAYFWQLGVENTLDKSKIHRDGGDIDLGPLKTIRLNLSARYPILAFPLKAVIGVYSQLIQPTAFSFLIIICALSNVVPAFYIAYGSLLIGSWVFNTILDLGFAFPSGKATSDSPK